MKNINKALKNEKGFASILAVCLLVLFTALGLACLLSASALVKNTQQMYSREQAKIYVVTFSQNIEREMMKIDNILVDNSGSELSDYLFDNMSVFDGVNTGSSTNTWSFYDESSNWGTESVLKEAIRTFKCTTESENIPETEIDVYWESNSAAMNDSENIDTKLETVRLNVIVRCTYNNESYSEKVTYSVTSGGGSARWYTQNEPEEVST